MTNFLLKKLLRFPFALAGALGSPPPGIAFLIYHKVGGRLPLEMDLPLPVFREQMRRLAAGRRVLAFAGALAQLQTGLPVADDHVVLTFDDGFDDFVTQAYPVLREFGLPAILYVNTGFVEDGRDYPLSAAGRWPVKPLSWEQLGRLHEEGLVTLGAHSHRHGEFDRMAPAEIEDDLSRSNALFQSRLGIRPEHFAYPRARWNEAAEAVVRRHYLSAVISGSVKARPGDCNPLRIPRIPVRRSDGLPYFKARMSGRLALEETFYALLKGTGR